MRQEARELQSKYSESTPEPDNRDDPSSQGHHRITVSKRTSLPENFVYVPAAGAGAGSLQMQLAHHRLNQKRQILQKQRLSCSEGVRRGHSRSQGYIKPYLPTDCLTGAPQGSELFQPIAEDEPSLDSNSYMLHQDHQVDKKNFKQQLYKYSIPIASSKIRIVAHGGTPFTQRFYMEEGDE